MAGLFRRELLFLVAATAILIGLGGCDMSATPLVPPARTPVATPAMPGATGTAPPVMTDETQPESALSGSPTPEPLDPTLLAWTVMVYNSADHPAWTYAWDAVNRMEAAGASGQVQVVAAVDWPAGADRTGSLPTRYVIRGNNDPAVITSEEAIGAVETNFGDAEVLADFISWAIAAYPANRYALILDGYGAGWRGCCLDLDAGGGAADALSPAEIAAALEVGLDTETGRRLDVLAFAGSMMGDFDALRAVAPFARYGVASAALVPAGGWDYQALLGALYANPWQDGRELAALLTREYVAFNRDLLGNAFVAMTATDLVQMDAISTAVDALAQAMLNDPAAAFGPAADARRGAQRYGAVLAGLQSKPDAVDLTHVASIMADRSNSAEIAGAADALAFALAEATVAQERGGGLPFAEGISIFWPVTSAAAAQADYAVAGALPNWIAFVAEFARQTATVPPPLVSVTLKGGNTASLTNPALMRAELFGWQIDEVQVVAARALTDGTFQLVQASALPPPLTPGSDAAASAYLWPDGRHEAAIPWDASEDYLYDAAGASSAVLLRRADASPAGNLLGASGQMTPGNGDAMEVVLEFPERNLVPAHVWHLAGDAAIMPYIHELAAAPGDSFRARLYTRDAAGQLQSSLSDPLVFDAVPTLYRNTRPLENGPYDLGLSATPLGATPLGASQQVATAPLRVNQVGIVAGFRTHVDPELGLAFPYPEGWAVPETAGTTIRTTDSTGETTLQVRVVEPWLEDAAALANSALANLGGVTTLFTDTTPVGSDAEPLTGARVAYGYEGADGRLRTGILTAFVRDGRGLVVDLDGLQAAEAQLLELAGTVAANWQFPAPISAPLAGWADAVLGGYSLRYPPGMAFEDANGWYRFVSGDHFIALRSQATDRAPQDALAALLAAAGEGVTGFQITQAEPTYLAGQTWQQGNFTYAGATGPIEGVILTRPDGPNEIAVWSEWPAGDAARLNRALAEAVAASMVAYDAENPGN